MFLVFDHGDSPWFDSPYLQEYKVKQFHLAFDYVKYFRNLAG